MPSRRQRTIIIRIPPHSDFIPVHVLRDFIEPLKLLHMALRNATSIRYHDDDHKAHTFTQDQHTALQVAIGSLLSQVHYAKKPTHNN